MKGVGASVCDLCQFGARWRKRTTFMFGGLDPFDAASLDRRCEGRGGVCTRSHRPHLQLEGGGPGGRHWTSIAEAYPAALCRRLAQLLVSGERHAYMHKIEKALCSAIVYSGR